MKHAFRVELERALAEALGEPVAVHAATPLGGGCISDVRRLETTSGPFLLKSNAYPLPRLFECEAEGLRALHGVGALTVPEPVCVSGGGEKFPPYLVTTFIESAPKRADFFEDFGRRFADHHRRGQGEQFGFAGDNYCGATPQPNGWKNDWVEFWREHRLGHQLKLAERNGFGGELQRLGAALMERLDSLIGQPDEPPTLLHGDLWSGNYMADSDGRAAIIDPAAYYGRREADLAMTYLFGGFSPEFYCAYEEAWPLEDGSRDRIEIYKLYHQLNHLNLFGGSYLGGCMAVLRRYGTS